MSTPRAADAFLAQHPQRMVNGCERNYHRALKEKWGRRFRLPTPVPAAESRCQPPQPQQSTPSCANLVSFRQNPKTQPPTARCRPGSYAVGHHARRPTRPSKSRRAPAGTCQSLPNSAGSNLTPLSRFPRNPHQICNQCVCNQIGPVFNAALSSTQLKPLLTPRKYLGATRRGQGPVGKPLFPMTVRWPRERRPDWQRATNTARVGPRTKFRL